MLCVGVSDIFQVICVILLEYKSILYVLHVRYLLVIKSFQAVSILGAIPQYFDIFKCTIYQFLCSGSLHIGYYNCIEKFLEKNIDHKLPIFQVKVKILRFY